jgi:hypothetical protein
LIPYVAVVVDAPGAVAVVVSTAVPLLLSIFAGPVVVVFAVIAVIVTVGDDDDLFLDQRLRFDSRCRPTGDVLSAK